GAVAVDASARPRSGAVAAGCAWPQRRHGAADDAVGLDGQCAQTSDSSTIARGARVGAHSAGSDLDAVPGLVVNAATAGAGDVLAQRAAVLDVQHGPGSGLVDAAAV